MPDYAKTPDPASETSTDAFEELLVRVVDVVESHGEAAFERLCAEHPQHAPRLRSHVRRLSEFGMLAATTPAAAVPQLPERLGDYRPLRRIGGGGMGNVYVAEQLTLGRRVALKLIRPEQLWFAGARERFAREVQAIAKLQHPGIVPVHDTGETAGLPWLAMELVEGAPLDEVLTRLGAGSAVAALTGADLERVVGEIVAARADATAAAPPPVANATRPTVFTGTWVGACLRIARAVADALVHAHERGVLHRDVKPSNVMLTPDGRALLLDFGLARTEGTAKLTQDQSRLGSPAYMSPELVRGSPDVDARTDVYSLGVTLYELLALCAPFADESPARTHALVLAARPVALRRRNATVPRDAELVCATAMASERERRYATMRAFAADLDNLIELRPVHARPPTPWHVLRRWTQRRPAVAIGTVAAVLLLVVAPTVFWLQQRTANAAIRDALARTERHREREQKAGEQAQRDRDAAREVVQQWLTRIASQELVDMPHMQGLRHDLLDAARDYHERFLAQTTDDPILLEQAADAAVQLAALYAELGDVAKAGAVAQRALELAQRLLDVRGHDAAAMSLVATAKGGLAAREYSAGRLQGARSLLADALPLQREALRLAPRDAEARQELVTLLRLAALAAGGLQLDDEVRTHYAEIQGVFAVDEGCADAPIALRQVLVGAAADESQFHLERGDTANAARAAQRVIAWRLAVDETTLTSVERIAAARAHDVAGRVRLAEGDRGAAEASARACVAEAERVASDLPRHANALRLLAGGLNSAAMVVQRDPDRRDEARTLYEQSIATMRRLIALDPEVVGPRINLATSLMNLGSVQVDGGDFAAAGALFVESQALAERGLVELPTSREAEVTRYNATWFHGQLAARQRDHRTLVQLANRLAALRSDAKTQRIAGALLAEACAAIAADASLAPAERTELLAAQEAEALRLLRTAADRGCIDHHYLATHEHLTAVRNLPGFPAIVARMRENAAAARAK